MKRFVIAAVAASVLAMPAAASAAETDTTSVGAPCTTPLVYCVQQVLSQIAINEPDPICNYGETYSECAFRIVRDTPDFAIDLVEAYVNWGGYMVGYAIDTAQALCGQVVRPCGDGGLL